MKTYQEQYREKLIAPEQAARLVRSNSKIMYSAFAGVPVDFDKALAERKEELRNVEIYYAGGLLPPLQTALCDPSDDHFVCISYYWTGVDRALGDREMVHFAPINLHETHDVTNRDIHIFDVFVAQVSPMDEHGFFNFGLSNFYSLQCVLKCKTVILEVNQNMPRVPGGSEECVHISQIDYVVEGSNSPLFELPPSPPPTDVEERIAKMLVEEIPDRACLQIGIGTLANLIGELLCSSDVKDLGIHTEMFCDSMVKLFDSGKITNMYKQIDRGKCAFTFALGSKSTYEFMRENPLMASHPSNYTNEPRIISMNDNVISINNAVEVDLTGQVCSESYGPRQISGTGGQLDFVLGAWYSKGGKSFLCLPSTYTDKEGNLRSRIVPLLAYGAAVTTPRTVVDYIVTEYGMVKLKYQANWRRAELLIELAHPNFRDELVKEAERLKIWRRTNKIT